MPWILGHSKSGQKSASFRGPAVVSGQIMCFCPSTQWDTDMTQGLHVFIIIKVWVKKKLDTLKNWTKVKNLHFYPILMKLCEND